MLDEVDGRYLGVTAVIELSQIHGNVGWKAAFDSEAYKINFAILNVALELLLHSVVDGTHVIVLTIANEDNCDIVLHRYFEELLFHLSEGWDDLCASAAVVFDAGRKNTSFADPGTCIEGDGDEIFFGQTLIPEVCQHLPACRHGARRIDYSDDTERSGLSGGLALEKLLWL